MCFGTTVPDLVLEFGWPGWVVSASRYIQSPQPTRPRALPSDRGHRSLTTVLATRLRARERSRTEGGGNSRGTGCDLVHILEPKINDRLDLMVQISSSKEVGSCPPYST